MTYAIATIAALLVLLAFAMPAVWIVSRACYALAAENVELRSAIEYRDDIIESRLSEDEEEPLDVDVECQCPRCLREAYSVN